MTSAAQDLATLPTATVEGEVVQGPEESSVGVGGVAVGSEACVEEGLLLMEKEVNQG